MAISNQLHAPVALSPSADLPFNRGLNRTQGRCERVKKEIKPHSWHKSNPDLTVCCLITILTEPSGYRIWFLKLLVSVCKFWIFSLLYISRQWTSSVTEHIARLRCTYTLLLWTSGLTPPSIILIWQWFRIHTVPPPGSTPGSKPTYGLTIHWVRKLKAIASFKEQTL